MKKWLSEISENAFSFRDTSIITSVRRSGKRWFRAQEEDKS